MTRILILCNSIYTIYLYEIYLCGGLPRPGPLDPDPQLMLGPRRVENEAESAREFVLPGQGGGVQHRLYDGRRRAEVEREFGSSHPVGYENVGYGRGLRPYVGKQRM